MARNDLDGRARKVLTHKTLVDMDRIMRRWCEFHRDVLDSNAGPEYFKEDGPMPTRILLNRFFFWLADSSEGNLYESSHLPSETTENRNITVRTMTGLAVSLFSAFAYYHQPLEDELRNNAMLWIRSKLTQELNLNREKKTKPIAYHRDVELVIAAIWDFRALASIKSIWAMFNTTLLTNLLIDGASRVGEFIPGSADSKEKRRFLEWGHLEFFALPGSDGIEQVTIYIIITAKWLKNHTHDHGHKKFIVHLLAPQLVFQDTCRLLVILALYQGRFQDFDSWESLMSCKASQYGSVIRLRSSCRETPVLTNHGVGIDGPDSLQPWTYYGLRPITDNLGRLASFKEKLTLTALRRGDAYILDKHCKYRSIARTLMGQQTEAAAFSTYLSKTSTTDVQGLIRDMQPVEDLTLFSGISLGRCEETPITLDHESFVALETHPDYLDALANAQTARERCEEESGSLAAARRAGSQYFLEYRRLTTTKQDVWRRLAELKFRAFREKAFNKLTAAKPVPVTTPAPVEEPQIPQIDTADLEEVEGHTRDVALDNALLVSQCIGQATATQVALLVASMPKGLGSVEAGGDAITTPTTTMGIAEIDAIEEAIDVASKEQHRLHRIFKHELGGMVGRIGRQDTHLSHFSKRYVGLEELYDRVTRDPDLSPQAVADLILELLSSERPIKDPPSHWLSADKTACVVCNEPLETSSAYSHIYRCLAKDGSDSAEAYWDTYLSSLPSKCLWSLKGKTPCQEDLSKMTGKERQAHIHKHFASQPYNCFWDGCKLKPEDRTEQVVHSMTAHSLIQSTASISCLVWCRYCQKMIIEPKYSKARVQHFEPHILEAVAMVKEYGYAGVHLGGVTKGIIPQPFIPRQCIFCLHNQDLDAEDRVVVNILNHAGTATSTHIRAHLQQFRPDDKLFCPASIAGGAITPLCSCGVHMTLSEAWEHIQDVHYGFKFAVTDAPGEMGRVRKKKSEKEQKVDQAVGTQDSGDVPIRQDDDDADDDADAPPGKKRKPSVKSRSNRFQPAKASGRSRGALMDLPTNKSVLPIPEKLPGSSELTLTTKDTVDDLIDPTLRGL